MRQWMFGPLGILTVAVGCTEAFEEGPYEPQGHGAGAPEVEWHVGLGTDLEEHVHEGHQTRDGGYIAIGHVAEEEEGENLDLLVIKTDASGNEEWQRRIGVAGQLDVGIAVAETDDGFVAGGGLHQDGSQQRLLVKLDPQGEVVWQRVYENAGVGAVRGIEVLADGSIVSTGYVGEEDAGYLFIASGGGFLMKTDASGNLLWDRSLNIGQGTKLSVRTDGGFTVLSTDWMDDTDVTNVGLTITDAQGQNAVTTHYGDTQEVQAFDFDAMADGGYVFAGHTRGYGVVNWDCLLGRVGPDGTLMWTKVFGQPRGYTAKIIHDECYGVRAMPDGGIVMAGGTGDEVDSNENGHPSGPSSEWKNYVVRTDGDGEVIWSAVYGDGAGNGNNAVEFIAVTEDGGLMLFTDSDSAPASTEANHFGFMKLARTQ